MIEASKLKAGMTFETTDGKLIRVLEANHHKPGKGNTVMRMKLRDVRTGSTFDATYRQKKNLNKRLLKHAQHSTYTKWMTRLISWIQSHLNTKYEIGSECDKIEIYP